MPVDKHGSVKILPHCFNLTNGVKSQILLRHLLILFAEILHADRGAIDMKHIQRDFSLKAWFRSPGVGGPIRGLAEAKSKIFRNMVMLHIKLKLTMHAALW